MEGIYDLVIYNLNGQVVYNSQMQYNSPGQYSISWDANNYASGIYIAMISNGLESVSTKLTLIK